MSKPIILVFNLPILYEILSEINNLFNYEFYNLSNEIELTNFIKKENTIFIVSKIKINQVPINQNIIVDNFPIRIFNLLERINILLLKEKFISQSQIRINGYELDVNSRVLIFKKKKLKLTQKETEIILFIKNHNREVSISSLRKNVWGHSSQLETHTVETHVYRLRKKIKDVFEDNKFIVSSENGYKI